MAAIGAMAMGFEDGIHNVHDPRLRPALLQLVMQTLLPEDHHLHHRSQQERHFLGSGSRLAQLEAAATMIRRHGLLSEPMGSAVAPGIMPFHGAAAKAAADARKGDVDAWVERLHGLLSSPVAETRYRGVCLLGVTFHEFTKQRFLESYLTWFQKLLVQLKPTEPTFIRAAVCAALNDFLSRLGTCLDYPGVRREGATLVTKLVQGLVQLLTDKDSSSLWNDAVDLLITVLKYFPSCLRQHYSNIEGILVAQLMDVEGNTALYERCARGLALLPRAHGESSAWSSMIRRILIAVNTELDRAFRGMEDVNSAEEAMTTLQPREGGWHFASANVSGQGNKRFWQQLVPRITCLLKCCHYLLVNPYPVPVPVPVVPLLALTTRILRVDGSRLPAAPPLCVSVSSAHQTALCAELPALHLCALDLLYSTICGARSQLLPRASHIVHLLTDAFRRCGPVPPTLRVKLYDISRQQLISLGAGMAEALAPVVVANALSDLRGSASGSSVFSPRGGRNATSMCPPGWIPAVNQRKRKEPGGVPGDQSVNGVPDMGCMLNELAIPLSIQISALKALEALLTAGGAMLPERVRAEVDSLLASVAMHVSSRTSSAGVGLDDEFVSMDGGISSTSKSFQVAAYQALLASLLSPSAHRPPYLAQGLAIFRKGRKEAGTDVAEICAHALLALDALIHPRCLPPLDASTVVAAAAAAAARANTPGVGNNISTSAATPNSQKVGKPPPTMPTVVPLPQPANLSYSSPLQAPPLKLNQQLSVDPWAEVDTWLGYGEDLGEDWRGLLAEDLSAEGLVFKGDQQQHQHQQHHHQQQQQQQQQPGTDGAENDAGFLEPILTRQEVICICDPTLEAREMAEQPANTIATNAGEEMDEALRYVAVDMPSSMTVLSTSGGEFSSSPRREIGMVQRSQELTQQQQFAVTSFSEMIDSDGQQEQDELEREVEVLTAIPEAKAMDISSLGACSKATAGTDSDSDVLPDIVDGDPDSD